MNGAIVVVRTVVSDIRSNSESDWLILKNNIKMQTL